MVGHTGDIEATVVACKAADEAVKVYPLFNPHQYIQDGWFFILSWFMSNVWKNRNLLVITLWDWALVSKLTGAHKIPNLQWSLILGNFQKIIQFLAHFLKST
eukprot:TRINITY_DN13390_c0_g1_i1.p1 TRINITY_DN13390_c0_g1~~TRINITY_DN13390_c0_g1_i1.p1  ORF type:complete len:102 (-),score=6.62 TRINITY_DN13390_c0_g1_i1:260-565(-)